MTYRSYIGGSVSGGYTNEQWGYAQSWMMYDIAALQRMYGADFTTNGGNTVYSWSPDSGDTLVNGVAGIEPGANRIYVTHVRANLDNDAAADFQLNILDLGVSAGAYRAGDFIL